MLCCCVVVVVDVDSIESQKDVLEMLEQFGFPVAKPWTLCKADEVMQTCLQREMNRKSSLYDIDGAVVKVNALDLQAMMGERRKCPKWAVAYKFCAEETETSLVDIAMQVRVHRKDKYILLLLYFIAIVA